MRELPPSPLPLLYGRPNMGITAAYLRDANYTPIIDKDGLIISKSITFAALTTGAVGVHTLFSISGACIAKVIGYCSVDVTGSGTIEVGIAGDTATLVAQTTGTAIDAGEFWTTNTPAIAPADTTGKAIGLDIAYKVASDTLTGGTVKFYCFWRPLSPDSTCEAA